MPTGTISISASIAGSSFIKSLSKTGDHPQSYEVPLPAASTVETWDYLTDITGTATMSSGHGLTDGTYDAYWSGGVRYGCTGVFTGDDLALTSGAGDTYPVDATAMTVCKQVEINAQIDGDNTQIIAIAAEFTDTTETSHCHVDFQDVGSASIEAIDLVANEPWTWWTGGGTTNPLTGNLITDAFCSNGSAAAAATLKILVLEDSTP